MELTSIEMKNWLCHNHKVVELGPLTIVAGPNSSGKSPVGDAIAFALTGELRRVKTAGERDQLLTEGSKAGEVTLRAGTWSTTRDIVSGKAKSAGAPPSTANAVREALPFLIEFDRFARADYDSVGMLLRKVMRVEMNAAAIKAIMIERGLSPERVKGLDSGKSIADWIAFATRTATEMRGAWKAATGEAYGSVKAATWTAPSTETTVSDTEMVQITSNVTVLDVQQGDLQRRLGAFEAEEARGASHVQNVALLKGEFGTLEIAKEHLLGTVAGKQEADAAAAEAREHLASCKTSMEHRLTCPTCTASLTLRDGHLAKLDAQHEPVSTDDLAEAEARVGEAETEAASHAQAVIKAQEAVAKATAAGQALDLIMPSDDTGVTVGRKVDVQKELADVQNRLGAARAAERAAQEAIQAARRAKQKTTEARNHHAAVVSWTAIATALAPDGVPGELLQKALAPFNATLRDFSAGVGWKQVAIGPLLDISAAGRRYDLLGESERWRADVMITMALAVHSDLKFVVIDRFDVLEPAARGRAMGWFLALTKAKVIDTILVMATLKAAPTAPPGAVVHWFGETTAQKVAA